MARRVARRGLTRIEVVVLLAAISMALQSYHDVFRVFPMGAMHAGDPQRPRIGPSWWYAPGQEFLVN